MSVVPTRALSTLVIALLALAPRAAEACYVCTSGRDDETRLAFVLTTAFMTALPLILVGGLVWFLRRRARALAARRGLASGA